MGKSYVSATISSGVAGPDGQGESTTATQYGSSMLPTAPSAPTPGITEDVLSTARNKHGQPVSRGEIGLDTIVKTAQGEWSVGALLATGELIQKPDGSIVAPEVAPQAAQQADVSEPAAESPDFSDPLSAEVLEISRRLVEGCTPEYAQGVVEMAAEAFEISDRTAGEVARQLGGSTEEASAMVAQVEAAYTAQATAAVERMGFPAEDVFAWAREHARQELGDAIRTQCATDSTRGYQAVVQKYTANLDRIMPDVLLSHDFGGDIEVKRHNGQVVVGRRGTNDFTPWRVAVQLGLVDVSFA